jgi:hypothetical protein
MASKSRLYLVAEDQTTSFTYENLKKFKNNTQGKSRFNTRSLAKLIKHGVKRWGGSPLNYYPTICQIPAIHPCGLLYVGQINFAKQSLGPKLGQTLIG